MASNALDQALELHREVLEDARRRLDAARGEEELPPQIALAELDEQLGRVRRRLAEAESAKAAAMARYDQAAAGYRRDIAELEARRDEIGGALGYEPGALPPGERPVDSVKGIGPQFRARLEEAGVRTARELAALEPAQLAAILAVSEERAAAFIEGARQVG